MDGLNVELKECNLFSTPEFVRKDPIIKLRYIKVPLPNAKSVVFNAFDGGSEFVIMIMIVMMVVMIIHCCCYDGEYLTILKDIEEQFFRSIVEFIHCFVLSFIRSFNHSIVRL